MSQPHFQETKQRKKTGFFEKPKDPKFGQRTLDKNLEDPIQRLKREECKTYQQSKRIKELEEELQMLKENNTKLMDALQLSEVKTAEKTQKKKKSKEFKRKKKTYQDELLEEEFDLLEEGEERPFLIPFNKKEYEKGDEEFDNDLALDNSEAEREDKKEEKRKKKLRKKLGGLFELDAEVGKPEKEPTPEEEPKGDTC